VQYILATPIFCDMPATVYSKARLPFRVICGSSPVVSLAERAGDPEQRADLLRFAGMWMSLTERTEKLPLPKMPHEI
jgi:hypothetical protein